MSGQVFGGTGGGACPWCGGFPPNCRCVDGIRTCVCGHAKSMHIRISGVLGCTIAGCACGPGCIHEGFVCADGTILDDEKLG